MKNRRTIVMAFLLCACLIVGMGYAAVTDTLTIGGKTTISAEQANEDFGADVYFSKADLADATNITTLAISDASTDPADAKDKIDFTIVNTGSDMEFAVAGNTATFKFTVQNDGTADATLAFNITAPEGFSLVITPVDATNTTNKVSGNGNTAEFLATITIVKTPSATIENVEFSVTVTATAADSASTATAPSTQG